MSILPTTKGKSSPEKVFKRLSEYRRKYNAEPNELWLLLHQSYPKQPLTAADCKKEVKKFMPGYTKSNFDRNKLRDSTDLAIWNAQKLNNEDIINHAPATNVFELVKKLNQEDDS